MLLKKTAAQMEAEAIQELLQGGQITNMSNGGRARSIISVISKQLGSVMDTLDVNTAMGFATSAVGYYLDLIGQMVGVDRRDAVAGYAVKEDKSLRFYVTTGRLKDYIISGIIPAGTLIQTSAGNISYAVDTDTAFADDATEVYVGAVAEGSGAEYRVGRGLLVVHNLGNPNVYVTNEKPISNGSDVETDSNYRYRVLNAWASRATSNLTALKLAALSTPGVADAILIPHFQGPGTVDVLLTPVGNRVTEAMVNAAQARIDVVAAAGNYVTVRGPKYVYITITTRIEFTADTPEQIKPEIRRTVQQIQTDYLADIPLGGNLVVQELRARTQEASDRILDHDLECISIDGQPQIIRNYRLFSDELFLPNPDVEKPIQVL